MADNEFIEGGLDQLSTVAGVMTAMLPAAGPPGAVVAGVISAAAHIASFINWSTADHATIPEALKHLQRQIDDIKSVLVMLNARIDQLVHQVAIESKRNTLRDLMDYLDQVRVLETRLLDRPQDLDTAVDVANECGVIIDKFLRNDFDIWRWTDVVVGANGALEAAIGRFKNLPTLPVYLMGVLTWVAARERVVEAGQTLRLVDDMPRVSRHLDAVSVRGVFDKYSGGDTGTPRTIAENIKWRIRALVFAHTKYPENRTCHFFFEVRSCFKTLVKGIRIV